MTELTGRIVQLRLILWSVYSDHLKDTFVEDIGGEVRANAEARLKFKSTMWI